MSKTNERFCPGGGGHMIEGDFCPTHDSRTGYRLGKLILWVSIILIVLWFFNGIWIECTVTDPEYFFSR